ncbi:sulfotransferase [Caldilinea sp.]|uniref:sulfotransferase family protein n=1 Tax=Caldilinea sp. TaxID=2293560 RepID=UPI002C2CE64A|nr:sulfotransferase [Anaerolineales bacterium]HQY93849.1 sulfotransferase [Caldilinea sp.]HRA65145.1 sulfotransferase [Caldilinea sp.]
MSLITIIGRGHGGTRAISHTLIASNVFMGEPLNRSGDLLPPEPMYDACRVLARYVTWQGGLEWDFSALHTMPIPDEFTDLLQTYLRKVLAAKDEHKGWKLPETTLVFPWIVRLFPDIKYIHWVRNPRDNILARHMTDDLGDFGVLQPDAEQLLRTRYPALVEAATTPAQMEELIWRARRAVSWHYQHAIVAATPKPANWLAVRFEDFINQQEATLARLEAYLGIPLGRIIVRREVVGRFDRAEGVSYFDFLEAGMREFGYEVPKVGA